MTARALRGAAARPTEVSWVLPSLVVVGATCFNAGLAVVNGNVAGLTQAPVVAAEATFVLAAHVIALRNYRPEMTPWYALLGLFAGFAVVRCAWTQTLDVKNLRDVMIIPSFVALGMTLDRRRLAAIFVTIQVVMVVFLVLEATKLDAFSAVFKIKEYYINTRGLTAGDFWNTDSDLFVSATRPDGSFLSLVDLHRLSSIFLEPVSLGNYCMVVMAFLCACWRDLGRRTRVFLALTTLAAMVGCDGRLAMASAPIMVGCCALAPRLSRSSALVYIPAVLLLGFVLVNLGRFEPGGDDFPGRIAHTVYLLTSYGPSEFLGVSDEFLDKAVDSGIAYLITTQSIFLVVALWATIALAARGDRPDQVRIVHAVMIYIALNMMVSFALLTIKTAALLWLTYGSIQRRTAAPGTARRRRAPAAGARAAQVEPVPAGVAAFHA